MSPPRSPAPRTCPQGRCARAAAAALLATSSTGCYAALSTGAFVPSSLQSEHAGVALNARVGMIASSAPGCSARNLCFFRGAVMAGVGQRFKFAPRLAQFAVGPEVVVVPERRRGGRPYVWPVRPFGVFGVHLLQFESVDNTIGFGMGTPHLELGVALWHVTVSVAGEYSVRFTPQPNALYGSLLVGVLLDP